MGTDVCHDKPLAFGYTRSKRTTRRGAGSSQEGGRWGPSPNVAPMGSWPHREVEIPLGAATAWTGTRQRLDVLTTLHVRGIPARFLKSERSDSGLYELSLLARVVLQSASTSSSRRMCHR